jgi:hypothetical protein
MLEELLPIWTARTQLRVSSQLVGRRISTVNEHSSGGDPSEAQISETASQTSAPVRPRTSVCQPPQLQNQASSLESAQYVEMDLLGQASSSAHSLCSAGRCRGAT